MMMMTDEIRRLKTNLKQARGDKDMAEDASSLRWRENQHLTERLIEEMAIGIAKYDGFNWNPADDKLKAKYLEKAKVKVNTEMSEFREANK
jgi:hypothetical protein